jgi:uncharacterized protein YjbI with pentapeptide repeats
MANNEHVAVLKKGVAAWNAWRTEHPEIRPDLRFLFMVDVGGGIYEYEADLNEAKLGMADLSGADLTLANLYGADLNGAKLGMADLSGARLTGANLYGADLNEAKLGMAVT